MLVVLKRGKKKKSFKKKQRFLHGSALVMVCRLLRVTKLRFQFCCKCYLLFKISVNCLSKPRFFFFPQVSPPTLTNQDSAGSGTHTGNGGAGKAANSSAPGSVLYCQTGQVIKKQKQKKTRSKKKKKERSHASALSRRERKALLTDRKLAKTMTTLTACK